MKFDVFYFQLRIGHSLNRQKNRPSSAHQNARKKKTTWLLLSFAVVFFLSWAPISILNITLDISKLMVRWMTNLNSLLYSQADDLDVSNITITFAFFHLIAMSSVVINPIMYGFLNEDFKKSVKRKVERLGSLCLKN